MRDLPDNQFEIVGDPQALPDDFFNALAALLLSVDQGDVADVDERKEVRR